MDDLRPRYLPFDGEPLKMAPGLFPLSTDFGNGCIDHNFFQLDHEFSDYIVQKQAVPSHRHGQIVEDAEDKCAHLTALDWLCKTLGSEYPNSLPINRDTSICDQWDQASLRIQADLALISMAPRERLIMTRVSFPSGWAPERILGQSFWSIHGPVPTFANRQRTATNLVTAMCQKGPFVRFVWTVCGDKILDHHPQTSRPKWDGESGGYLRVERQVTVPFGTCALFLIRTYLYPLDSLTIEARQTLAKSLSIMPESFARYKGLTEVTKTLSMRLSKASNPKKGAPSALEERP